MDRQAALARLEAHTEKPPLFDWRGDLIAGPPAVNIVLNEQKAYIFRGGQEAGWTYLASGTSAHNTPTGTFRVMEKKEQKSSNTYGVIVNSSGNVVDWDAKAGRDRIPRGGRFVGAPMPYWMRLTSYGIGMHAGPIPQPGLPASHGCIRLPEEMAAKLFEIVDVGTPVIITGHAPTPHEYAVRTTGMVSGAE
jgi:lipoprotein-anchoring transpeptidase ErfK/SrfK